MASGFALLIHILLASMALAFLSPSSRHRARLARRPEGRQVQPINHVESLTGDVTNDATSPNWGGAVWNQGPGTFTTISAVFTVPTPSLDVNGGAAIWVGIDGNTCGSAIFQTGIDVWVSENGEPSYSAWYEWYPDVAWDISDSAFTISAGDTINATITTYSANDGTAFLENWNTGQKFNQYYESSHTLCQQDAEWIVEDYDLNGVQVSFADFGTVTFYDAVASGPDAQYTPSGANILNIIKNGEQLTSTSINEDNTITISYS